MARPLIVKTIEEIVNDNSDTESAQVVILKNKLVTMKVIVIVKSCHRMI